MSIHDFFDKVRRFYFSLNKKPVKWIISRQFICGNGIEIGALHNPLDVSELAKVRYVDRLTLDELYQHYPELKNRKFVKPDIIDNGEKLEKIADESLDFIIANHMLEHCVNPLGTIETHLKKIKKNGILYITVPDKNFIFDKDRELTSFKHLMDDYNGLISQYPHYVDFVKYSLKFEGEKEIEAEAKRLFDMAYSIHYHVWDKDSYLDFLIKAMHFLKIKFSLELYYFNENEIISILRKV